VAIDAALYSGSKCYFFRGNRYLRVTRGDTRPGIVDSGYPAPISNWGWPGGFGASGIDASLYSGSKCYFFRGNQYIRVTRGDVGPGTVDPGYPAPISNWGWPGGFGSSGIDAALYSHTKCYFFKGNQYIRVTRGDVGPGTVDPGYPAPISNWGWPGGFGSSGIDAALYSHTKCYFFKGDQYIRVTREDTGPGAVDPGYPAPLSNWGWNREFIVVHFKSLLPITSTLRSYMNTQFAEMQKLFAPLRIDVRRGTTQDLSGDPNLSTLRVLDVGPCLLGQTTDEQDDLFANRDDAADNDLVVYVVDSLQGGMGNFVGCASHPDDQPGAAVADNVNALWLTAHEIGHVLALRHVSTTPSTNSDFLMWPNIGWTNVPPDVSSSEDATMLGSDLTRPVPF
jgi:Hemopexin